MTWPPTVSRRRRSRGKRRQTERIALLYPAWAAGSGQRAVDRGRLFFSTLGCRRFTPSHQQQMSKSDYRDLRVWRKARLLASRVYRVTADFPKHELFALTQQMRRAVLSVACNIAEGQGRRSTADRIQFLVIARGSLLELETQAIIAADLEYLPPTLSEDLVSNATEVTRMLNGLIRHYMRRRD